MKMNTVFLLSVLTTLCFTQCGYFENLTGSSEEVSASESADVFSATLVKINQDGVVMINMPVSAFTNSVGNLDDSSFSIEQQDELVAENQLASDYRISDLQQIATSYDLIQYSLSDVVDGDKITIYITRATDPITSDTTDEATPEIALSGNASSQEDSLATQIAVEEAL